MTGEPLEPEVLSPESGNREAGSAPRQARRPLPPYLPVLAGLLIDIMDFTSWGWVGLLLGFAAGYWIAGILERPPHSRILIGLVSGLYCALPATNLIPAGTLFGLLTALTGTASEPRR